MEERYEAVILHDNGHVETDDRTWMEEHYPWCKNPECDGCYSPRYDNGDQWIDKLRAKHGDVTVTVYVHSTLYHGWMQLSRA